MWAHGMFPKGDFAGTIARVENVCRTRRLEVGPPYFTSTHTQSTWGVRGVRS